MFLWGMICPWDIQECYQKNKFKNNPSLTGLMARRRMINSDKNPLKAKLALVEIHNESIESLGLKLKGYHK